MLRQPIRRQCFDIGVMYYYAMHKVGLAVNHYTCEQQRPRRDGDND